MSMLTEDRRWLWRVEGFLSVNATLAVHHQVRRELLAYLRETCEHFWELATASGGAGEPGADLLQCRYCFAVKTRVAHQGAGSVVAARHGDLVRARNLIAAGGLPAQPTAEGLRTALGISLRYARACRDALTATAAVEPPVAPQRPVEPPTGTA